MACSRAPAVRCANRPRSNDSAMTGLRVHSWSAADQWNDASSRWLVRVFPPSEGNFDVVDSPTRHREVDIQWCEPPA